MKTTPEEVSLLGTERSVSERVLDDYSRGISAARIKARFNLSDSEFTDMTGDDETPEDDTGRSPVTGY